MDVFISRVSRYDTKTPVATARILTSRLGREPRVRSKSVVNLPTSDIVSCMV